MTKKSEIQAFLFDKSKTTTGKARDWIKKQGYTPIKRVDETLNLYRYRIKEPIHNAEYRTIKINDGIKAVLMWK